MNSFHVYSTSILADGGDAYCAEFAFKIKLPTPLWRSHHKLYLSTEKTDAVITKCCILIHFGNANPLCESGTTLCTGTVYTDWRPGTYKIQYVPEWLKTTQLVFVILYSLNLVSIVNS